jgi:flavin reductase (DIM6/NTAB) family NADH-FMN oxidoreductase RutF
MNTKRLESSDIEAMDRIFRLNLINSLSGYKSANLIGTEAKGYSNLAIFNSVVHIGANPPLLGMIQRPHTVERQTLENIRESGTYTINHLTEALAQRGHYTSAKFERDESEFEECNIEKVYLDGFDAPFVKESPIKVGMQLKEEILIKSNDTILIVGEIKLVDVREDLITENGQLNLNQANIVSISGLNRYHRVREIANYPYARKEELPHFN